MRDVIADKEDDQARLRIADWLNDQGREQDGDYIRYAVANPGRRHTCEQDTEVGLFCGGDTVCYNCQWAMELGYPKHLTTEKGYHLGRGFVETVKMQEEFWLVQGADLVRQHPITLVQIEWKEPLKVNAVWTWERYRPSQRKTQYGVITNCLFDQLFSWLGSIPARKRWCHVGLASIMYNSWKDANDALSDACLMWAHHERREQYKNSELRRIFKRDGTLGGTK